MTIRVERIRYRDMHDKARRKIRCEIPCTDPTTRGKPCPANAMYRVDDMPMCRRHAGATVLDRIAVEEGDRPIVWQFWG